MKRGGYGKPWRPPADGWFAPPKIFFGGLYQHARPALNNLPRYQNNTQVTLQQKEVGPPVTRINPAALVANCGVTDTSGLPEIPWIGVGANQALPPVLGGTLQNTFALNGTNNLGQAARLRGFKNVQALRQWHGTPPWTSHDPVSGGCLDTYCNVAINDMNGAAPTDPGWIPTYSSTPYEAYQATPATVKYLTCTLAATLAILGVESITVSINASAGGSISVDPYSGKITSTMTTAETDTGVSGNPSFVTYQVSGGQGYRYSETGPATRIASGATTLLDGLVGADIHCAGGPAAEFLTGGTTTAMIGAFNAFVADRHSIFVGDEGGLTDPAETIALLPPITNPNSYNATGTYKQSYTNYADDGSTYTQYNQWQMVLSWSRTDTVYEYSISFILTSNSSANPTVTVTTDSTALTATYTLSNPNPSSAVYADVKTLLGYWNLGDDAQYPPRTDGIWQIAPLVSRDEAGGDITPLQGFLPATVNDLRQPVVDANGNHPWTWPVSPPPPGWTYSPNNNDGNGNPPGSPGYAGPVQWNPTYNQMAWFDPNAYGFSFPAGFDQSSSAANGWGQFALTGLICGMPMPRAFTEANSFWYNPADAAPPAGATFENFFDFRANVWRACSYEADGGGYTDFYQYGYGQWLYDAIDTTGAQLPHGATQWTNLFQAFNKPPYAYLIQGDQQTYDQDDGATVRPGPDGDFKAFQGDALWAQKCCEILELWPSQNFGRPAGADRFAPDETAVYCIGHWESNVVFLLSDPANIRTGDYVGVSNNGFAGVFPVTVDHGAESLTLGTQLYPLPTGFALPSGDTGTCVWKIRFPNAPAILGRDAIASLTASGGNTIVTLAGAEVNLMTGDTIDICSANITYDANGNRVSEQMTVLQTVAVSRTDDTHFTVCVAIGTLAGAAYIVSHGAPAWYWDDNGRKGDFAALQWLYDYRTNGEQARLTGATDCGGHKPPSGPPTANTGYQAPSVLPAVCSPGNSLKWTVDNFQAQGASVFKPCCYGVVAITPNGETWKNGVVISFPASFNFDDRYGARWQAEVEQAMQDLLWQAPHVPCTFADTNNGWKEDDGTCLCPSGCPNTNGGTDYYYAHAPFVEARLSLPTNGGNGQNETAPALPSGISIGYINPVTTLTNALTPPGMIGYDPASGNPTGAFTFWGYRLDIENNACFGACQFHYVDAENLPCVVSYAPAAPAAIADPVTNSGSTSDSTVT